MFRLPLFVHRPVEQSGTVFVFLIDIRPFGNEELGYCDITTVHCQLEWSPVVAGFRINIRPLGYKVPEILEDKFLVRFPGTVIP